MENRENMEKREKRNLKYSDYAMRKKEMKFERWNSYRLPNKTAKNLKSFATEQIRKSYKWAW